MDMRSRHVSVEPREDAVFARLIRGEADESERPKEPSVAASGVGLRGIHDERILVEVAPANHVSTAKPIAETRRLSSICRPPAADVVALPRREARLGTGQVVYQG